MRRNVNWVKNAIIRYGVQTNIDTRPTTYLSIRLLLQNFVHIQWSVCRIDGISWLVHNIWTSTKRVRTRHSSMPFHCFPFGVSNSLRYMYNCTHCLSLRFKSHRNNSLQQYNSQNDWENRMPFIIIVCV